MDSRPKKNRSAASAPVASGVQGSDLSDLGDVVAFQSALTEWFRAEGRDYPWRRTRDPYAILVSEAMLQQTQIATVLGRGYYSRWMEAFPGWKELAAASEEEILKQWEGLGYYNRARNLRKAASIVSTEHGGRAPDCLDTLLSLPGVGRYTAGAVMSFAFNKRAAIVDGNVSRVFSRLFACPEPIDTPAGLRLAWERAEALTPESEVRLYNSAVMELGQRICTRQSPSCGICPVSRWCRARREGEETAYPVKKGGKVITAREEMVLLAVRGGKVWLCAESGTRRKGLWRLPELAEEEASDLVEIFRFDYAITRYRVTLRVFLSAAGPDPLVGGAEAGWFSLASERNLPPLGSPYRRVLRKFSENHEDLIMNG